MGIICTMQNVLLEKEDLGVSFDIAAGSVTALIANDEIGSKLLQAMGGFRAVRQGEVFYPCMETETASCNWLQYVPDDIICYNHLKIKDYLRGAAFGAPERLEEYSRLCDVFEINVDEELLNLTFEQNRLVALISAIACNPKLLLLDRPNDMLGRQMYLRLWKELNTLKKNGTTIVFTIDEYADIIVPCDRHLFFRDGELKQDLYEKELPLPAKVITLKNGSIEPFDSEKMEILYEKDGESRILYREEKRREIALCISETDCRNFFVEELSMEEELFEDYERWML